MHEQFPQKPLFFEFVRSQKFSIISELILLLCNENLNSFLTRLQKLFQGGKYSRDEKIRGNTVIYVHKTGKKTAPPETISLF